ncbi:MAG: hypothetical protein LBB41_06950 [Prevotellaceae bacterium]|jgi:hypothetical protein|nr:hypothetical protein [Prevotellaceae bacterium]
MFKNKVKPMVISIFVPILVAVFASSCNKEETAIKNNDSSITERTELPNFYNTGLDFVVTPTVSSESNVKPILKSTGGNGTTVEEYDIEVYHSKDSKPSMYHLRMEHARDGSSVSTLTNSMKEVDVINFGSNGELLSVVMHEPNKDEPLPDGNKYYSPYWGDMKVCIDGWYNHAVNSPRGALNDVFYSALEWLLKPLLYIGAKEICNGNMHCFDPNKPYPEPDSGNCGNACC